MPRPTHPRNMRRILEIFVKTLAFKKMGKSRKAAGTIKLRIEKPTKPPSSIPIIPRNISLCVNNKRLRIPDIVQNLLEYPTKPKNIPIAKEIVRK
ncbi:MAG: hypothetical protein QXL89_03070 [Nitrososphaeria archaeon]